MDAGTDSPIIVGSPVPRAGTTLVQRLLCSAPNTLIYGDVVGQEMDFLSKYALMRRQMLAAHDSIAIPQREGVSAGNVNDFITSLAPPAATMDRQWREAALTWLRGCAEDAASAGRTVWGWKLAGPDGYGLGMLAAWLPAARWVWIEREPRDCFRSAKAARMVSGAEDARAFLHQSRESSRLWTLAAGASGLRLEYSAMLADPAGTVRRLEEFTGASGIDTEVFTKRINEAGARWTPPADLSPEEDAIFATGSPSQSHSAAA
jgi:Sulfotransferase family